MLQSYVELIKSCIDKLTSLGPENNTFLDYIQAVGYEFLIIGIELLYLAGIAVMIAFPFLAARLSTSKMKQYYDKKYPKANLYYKYCYWATCGPKISVNYLAGASEKDAYKRLLEIHTAVKELEESQKLLFSKQTVLKVLVDKAYDESQKAGADITTICKNLHDALVDIGIENEINEAAQLYDKVQERVAFFKIFISIIIGVIWLLFLIPFALMML